MEVLAAEIEARDRASGYSARVPDGPVASSTPSYGVRKFLNEPLLQFIVVGIALFGVWHVINPAADTRGPSNRIVLTEDDLRQMALVWVAQGRPPPTSPQMQIAEC